MFEIKARDGLARIGILHTPHGIINTPAILPVINPHLKILEIEEMLEMGAQAFITNSYIIYSDEKLRKKAMKEGLHKLIGFDGPIMTDSGSFQMYVYGIELDALQMVKFQRDIGSDIGTIVDIFSENADYERAKEEMEETVRRARESMKEKGEMMLACTVQGGIYGDLRKKCAKKLAGLRCDVYPIGGVVPLMENQRYADIAEIIIESKKELPPSRPVHLFGAGHPIIFPMAVALGCDMFDSASYVKYARDNRLIFSDRTIRLSEMDENICNCPACSSTTIDELRHMDEKRKMKLIAMHNLWQTFMEIRRVRQAIREGNLWEMMERRAYSHPSLMEAMEVIKDNRKWLEKWENISRKRALMYTGGYSIYRPIIYRFQKRIMERYQPFFEKSIIFEEMEKPYSRAEWMKKIEANCIIEAPFAPVPLELDEIYPVAQSIFPWNIDTGTERERRKISRRFYRNLIIAGLDEVGRKSKDFDLRKIKSIANYQFGEGAGDALFDGEVKIIKSRTTGKIRNVICDGKHVVSMRATDGFFTLKIEGGKKLHSFFTPPQMRVVVDDDASPFIKMGKNVFAKFVVDACREIRPYDEVLIVNEEDELLGVGQSVMNREEMLDFERGMAVKTREGIQKEG